MAQTKIHPDAQSQGTGMTKAKIHPDDVPFRPGLPTAEQVRDLALPGRGYTPFHRTGPKTDMATIVLLRVSGNRIEEWCGSHWRWSTPNPEILHRPCSAQGNARPWEMTACVPAPYSSRS